MCVREFCIYRGVYRLTYAYDTGPWRICSSTGLTFLRPVVMHDVQSRNVTVRVGVVSGLGRHGTALFDALSETWNACCAVQLCLISYRESRAVLWDLTCVGAIRCGSAIIYNWLYGCCLVRFSCIISVCPTVSVVRYRGIYYGSQTGACSVFQIVMFIVLSGVPVSTHSAWNALWASWEKAIGMRCSFLRYDKRLGTRWHAVIYLCQHKTCIFL